VHEAGVNRAKDWYVCRWGNGLHYDRVLADTKRLYI